MYINVSKTLSFTLWALNISYYLCFIIISIKTVRQDLVLSLALLLQKDLIRKGKRFFQNICSVFKIFPPEHAMMLREPGLLKISIEGEYLI